jgi:glycosyltransferase involved in cell wall biosynthesis
MTPTLRPSPEPIADCLALVLPAGSTLRAFHERGPLEHLAALLARIARRFHHVALIHHGPPDEPIPCDLGMPALSIAAGPDGTEACARLLARTGPVGSAIVRTHHIPDAGVAARLATDLRARGTRVGHIARLAHLGSRFAARQQGPASQEAIDLGLVERDACLAADLVVGTTGIMVDDLAWRWHLPAEHTRVVPNFVDDHAQPGPLEGRDPSLIVTVGPLFDYKNIDRIIEAVSQLPDAQRAAARLVIVGSGPEEAALRHLAARLGVRCEFAGHLPHGPLHELLCRAGVYVHASKYEGHPKALIEAMNSGCPVVVASGWGVTNLIENGVSGVLIPGSTDSIAYAVSGILEDESWREMLGSAAAASARMKFGLTRVAELELDAMKAALALGSARVARAA